MPRLLFLILLLIGANTVFAQQDPQYSQYMYNTMIINPGYAGSEDAISAALLHREEMVGMPGKPSTSVFHVNAPVKLFNANHGLGVSIINENIAFNKNIGGSFSYAFRLPIRNIGKLGIGISGGFQNEALDAEWNAIDGTTGDKAIPQPRNQVFHTIWLLGFFIKQKICILESQPLILPSLKLSISPLH
jgi:type IX secretion system PorP/SprF family membrane protein